MMVLHARQRDGKQNRQMRHSKADCFSKQLPKVTCHCGVTFCHKSTQTPSHNKKQIAGD